MQHVEEESHTGPFNSLKEIHNEAITKQWDTLMQFLISNLNRMLSDLQKMRRQQKLTIGETISELSEIPQWNWEYGSQQHDETQQ
jgi:superoxide dismutase